MIISLSVQSGLELHQLDITMALLNGNLKEEVYMRQPDGFSVSGQENLVCQLNKSLYGLKQAPRCWNSTLNNCLKKLGLQQSNGDPCIYISLEQTPLMIVGVYVDDIVIACKYEKQLLEFKKGICEKFNVKDLGRLHYFLGLKVVRKETGDVWIG